MLVIEMKISRVFCAPILGVQFPLRYCDGYKAIQTLAVNNYLNPTDICIVELLNPAGHSLTVNERFFV